VQHSAIVVFDRLMPVKDLSPEYAAALPWWKRPTDVMAGEHAVKAAGEAYLSRLDAQS